MPLTFTGRNVKADNNAHPSLVDIAVGLSRQPRFGGQTRRWWSVLDHTLFGDELVKDSPDVPPVGGDDIAARRLWRLAWLLHDAHEALTGDIPTPFKGDDTREIQDKLDTRIMAAYLPGGTETYADLHFFDAIKDIDARAMRAEAMVVGPPTAGEHLAAFGITPMNADQVAQDRDTLNRMIVRLQLGTPPGQATERPEDHPAVKMYLSRLMELL